jgi:hypothetical protein
VSVAEFSDLEAAISATARMAYSSGDYVFRVTLNGGSTSGGQWVYPQEARWFVDGVEDTDLSGNTADFDPVDYPTGPHNVTAVFKAGGALLSRAFAFIGTGAASPGGDSGSGGLAAAKGKITLTGFDAYNGKYVYSGCTINSTTALLGINGAEWHGSEYAITMPQIENGSVEIPLYTMNAGATTVDEVYVPYEGNDALITVSIIIVDDADGKFTSSDAAGFATSYAAIIVSNSSNTSFTPTLSSGNLTIPRSDALTTAEMTAQMGSNPTIMQTTKYLLMEAAP